MPPRWRNQRDPTGPDTPTATAASSLLSPSAILAQNARSTSRRGGGRPGERIGARPVLVDIHAVVRPIVTPLLIGVLRRPLESAQYTSAEFDAFTKRYAIRRSVGRTGVCWDNAAAESFFATLKNEMYYRQTFATRARARFAVAEYIEVFYNRRRLHSTLGYRTPFEALTDYRTVATAAA